MTISQAVFLGIIEGMTEFLPVSSTAHLIIAQRWMGLESISLFFTTVVQLGALLAVIVYFHKKIFQHIFSPTSETALLALSSLPVLLVGFIFRHQIEKLHGSLLLIAFMSIAVGAVIALAQWYAVKTVQKEKNRNKGILAMGLCQILALIPGTSRSGITIAGGLFLGLSFEKALEYSFLLSIPALGVAGGYELLSALSDKLSNEVILATTIGTIAAFLSALVVIKSLLQLVRRYGFMPFVIYRILFGILILTIK